VTRQAAREGFETFVDDAIAVTAEEFSVARALRQGVRGPGGRVVDRLLKDSDALWERVVRPELDAYRDQICTQFDVVLDYVADDAGIDAYRADILAVDSYAEALRDTVRGERRERIHDDLVARQQALGDAVAPLVAAPEEEFWAALATAYDHDRAVSLVEDHFAFTGPLRAERDAYVMATTFDPADVLGGFGSLLGGLPTVEVEYTDEAIRSMRRAEQTVIAETKREITRRFS
jgi:hypothetical protein